MFINNVYAETDTMIVQDTQSNIPEAPSAIENSWTSFIPMVAIFAVFYFFLIRPQEKKRKLQESLVSGVKKGEEVLTNSGIYGIVTKINESDNIIYLEIAKDVEIKVLKTAIVDIVSRHTKKDESVKKDTKNHKKSQDKT